MKPIKIYLAGAMEKSKDHGVGWRKELTRFIKRHSKKAKIPIKIVDPAIDEAAFIKKRFKITPSALKKMDRSEARYQQIARTIRERDLKLIQKCDILLARICPAVIASCGTLSELSHATEYGIPTIAFLMDVDINEVPLWAHASVKRWWNV